MLKKTALLCLAAGLGWGGVSALDARWTESDRIQGQYISEVPSTTTTTTTVIMEDDPRWDCETMGNRICGPVHLHINADNSWCVWDQDEPIACGTYEQVHD